MRKHLFFGLVCLLFFSCLKSEGPDVNIVIPNPAVINSDSINYLALGDSYTIGTSIDIVDGFPNQTFQLLRGAGLKMSSLQIIAKNGWTADDLKNG